MKILVVDKYNSKRDLAQSDMYEALSEKHQLRLVSPEELSDSLSWADVLWLGIYHQVLPLNFNDIFKAVTCPVLIDQADNEDFIRRFKNIPYHSIKSTKVVLSRYLPHEWIEPAVHPIPVKQLSWYINPNRFAPQEKTIDVAFVCSIYRQRSAYSNAIKTICDRRGWSCFIGQAYGEEYANILGKSKVFIAECSRKCYTQKYTEAILSGCTIVGDRPVRPENSIQMYDANFPNVEQEIELALSGPRIDKPKYSDKDFFLNEFESLV